MTNHDPWADPPPHPGRVHGQCRLCGWQYAAADQVAADQLFQSHYALTPGHADATTAQLRERLGLPAWTARARSIRQVRVRTSSATSSNISGDTAAAPLLWQTAAGY